MNWNSNMEQNSDSGQQTPQQQDTREKAANAVGMGNSQTQTSHNQMYQRQAQMAVPSHMLPFMQQQSMPGFMQGPNQFVMGTPTGSLYGNIPFNMLGVSNMLQQQAQQMRQTQTGNGTQNVQAQTPSAGEASSAFYNFQQNAALQAGIANGFGLNSNTQPYYGAGGQNSSSATPTDSRFSGGNFPMSYTMPPFATSAQTSPYMNGKDENNKSSENIPEKTSTADDPKNEAPLRQSAASSLRFQYLRKYKSDQAILKLHCILNEMNIYGGKIKELSFWQQKLTPVFLPSASIRYTSKHANDVKCFDLSAPMIPVIWAKVGASDMSRVELVAPQLRAQTLSNGSILFHSPSTTCTYFYADGSYMSHSIQLKGIFDSSLRIQWLELCAYNFVPGVEWSSLERVLNDKAVCNKIFEKLRSENATDSMDNAENKNGNVSEELQSNFTVFKNNSAAGTYDGFLRFLQISDIMSSLSDLLVYQKKSKTASPIEALSSYINLTAKRNNQNENHSNDLANGARKIRNDNFPMNNTTNVTSGKIYKQVPPLNNDTMNLKVSSISPGCSPRDTQKPNTAEKPPSLKRKKSNKNVAWPPRDYSGSSTPSYESGDRSIPGTKKIKF